MRKRNSILHQIPSREETQSPEEIGKFTIVTICPTGDWIAVLSVKFVHFEKVLSLPVGYCLK